MWKDTPEQLGMTKDVLEVDFVIHFARMTKFDTPLTLDWSDDKIWHPQGCLGIVIFVCTYHVDNTMYWMKLMDY